MTDADFLVQMLRVWLQFRCDTRQARLKNYNNNGRFVSVTAAVRTSVQNTRIYLYVQYMQTVFVLEYLLHLEVSDFFISC